MAVQRVWRWWGGLFLGVLGMSLSGDDVCGQAAINDEAQVPAYELPALMVDADGQPITDLAGWERQRAKLLERFTAEMFGRRPSTPYAVRYETQTLTPDAETGVQFKQVTMTLETQSAELGMQTQRWRLLLILPPSDQPVPVFLGLNFQGNHTVTEHPEVALPEGWVRRHEFPGGQENRAAEEMRGAAQHRWPWRMITEQGFGVATMYYGDIDADEDDQFAGGVHQLLRDPADPTADWASISAWAWGLSRALDYLETDPAVNAKQVAVLGHSRLGKTSLWAGATDPRFALVVSNNSGCGGAALHRRRFGETVARINQVFPHWFNARFKTYNDREDTIPFDQHQLIACLAPRPVYVASASEDLWADPRGEFLSVLHASPVYSLYGVEGFGLNDFPPVDTPCLTRLGYHLRSGPHEILEYDWQQFLRHARRHGLGQALTQD